MAFDFLKNIDLIADTATTVGGAALNFMGRDPYDEIDTLQPYLNALEASKTYSRASLNPDDPYNKNLTRIEEDKIRRNFIEGLRDLERRNRRAMTRGVVGVNINPERRDEMIASAIAQNRVESGDQARSLAAQKLSAAAGRESGRAGALQGSFPLFERFGQLDREGLAGGIEGMGDLARILGQMFQGGGNTGVTPSQGGRLRQAPSGDSRGFLHGMFGGGV